MKLSEAWLHEWIKPQLTREVLSQLLTMSGLEVEAVTPVAQIFKDIFVGQITKTEKHPNAERLFICTVDIGKSSPLSIVCGAPNVKVGLKVPVAIAGAMMPDGKQIKADLLRGVMSNGMLLSAAELALTDDNEGLLALPSDAPIGMLVWEYLALEDFIFDISITPNRGDCLSIKGIAREISALTELPYYAPKTISVKTNVHDRFALQVQSSAGCPRYVGRIIRNVKADSESPIWLKERLRRSGMRSIHPIVDVTNYVMLELGQPMHAFDFNTIKDGIIVRDSKPGEQIALLDGSEQTLDAQTLVIADAERPLAIAGVMGGLDSSVTLLTSDILLESAYFSPKTIARQRQQYLIQSESAYRFERGIDPTIQVEAIERATQLILEITGGEAGAIVENCDKLSLPQPKTIVLTHKKITALLGLEISDKKISNIFKNLKFDVKVKSLETLGKCWEVIVPAYRSDLSLPEDLIEEVARIYGYDNIPTHRLKGDLNPAVCKAEEEDLSSLRTAFCHQGFQEIISYSFVDARLQALLDPDQAAWKLVNPITADMAVMRTNTWPGLVNTYRYNKSRQQQRIRIFEIGTCFVLGTDELLQKVKLGGLIAGNAFPEQWGIPHREVDFFDLKGPIETILHSYANCSPLIFKAERHPALHPGQSAAIYQDDHQIGMAGALHPLICQALEIGEKVFVFELDLNLIKSNNSGQFLEVSKFPEIRRDLAILVNEAIPAREIQDTIKKAAGDWLTNVFVFDVYQGQGIKQGYKSIALALILQHPTRTLVDEDVAILTERIIAALNKELGAELRS